LESYASILTNASTVDLSKLGTHTCQSQSADRHLSRSLSLSPSPAMPADTPPPDHALLTHHAPDKRPPLLHIDRRLPQRAHQARRIPQPRPVRELPDTCTRHARLGSARADIQRRLLRRLVEAGRARCVLHLPESAPVCGRGEFG